MTDNEIREQVEQLGKAYAALVQALENSSVEAFLAMGSSPQTAEVVRSHQLEVATFESNLIAQTLSTP